MFLHYIPTIIGDYSEIPSSSTRIDPAGLHLQEAPRAVGWPSSPTRDPQLTHKKKHFVWWIYGGFMVDLCLNLWFSNFFHESLWLQRSFVKHCRRFLGSMVELWLKLNKLVTCKSASGLASLGWSRNRLWSQLCRVSQNWMVNSSFFPPLHLNTCKKHV